MTRWSYDEVREIYKRAENAESRAEKAEVGVAELKARIETLNSRIHPGDPDLIPKLEADVERVEGQLATLRHVNDGGKRQVEQLRGALSRICNHRAVSAYDSGGDATLEAVLKTIESWAAEALGIKSTK